MRSRITILVLLTTLSIAAGCREGSTFATLFGATDKPQPAPVTIDILCDASSGSSCNALSLMETVGVALKTAGARPGSTVRLWMLGKTIETTRVVAAAVSPTGRITSRHARAYAESRWRGNESVRLACAGRTAMRQRIRRSPIAESLGVVALAPVPQHEKRYLVVITDALEESKFGEFECGRLPKPDRFVRSLAEQRVLPPSVLAGAHVTFCHVDFSAIDGGRCSASLDRAAGVRDLWTRALVAAGASSVEIRQGGLPAIGPADKEADTNG